MRGKRHSLSDSKVRSCFIFQLPDESNGGRAKEPMFRDSAAIPLLRKITEGLRRKGFAVSVPKPGTACHAASTVGFPDVRIIMILLVSRRGSVIEFHLLTWPSEPFVRRIVGRTRPPDEFEEWARVCSSINETLVRDVKPYSLEWTTFRHADN